ncbi:MAG: hypothetical protein ABR582_12615 [Gemmatimonadaceae bacterium]
MRLVPSFHLSYPDVRALRIALAAGAVAGLVVTAACTDNSASKAITGPGGPRNATIGSGGFGQAKSLTLCVDASSPPGTYVFKNIALNRSFAQDSYNLALDGNGFWDGTYWNDPGDGGAGATAANANVNVNYNVTPGPAGCVLVLSRTTGDPDFMAALPISEGGSCDPQTTSCGGKNDSFAAANFEPVSNDAGAVYDHTDCLVDDGTLVPEHINPTTGNPPVATQPWPQGGFDHNNPPAYVCGSSNLVTRAFVNYEHGVTVTYVFKNQPVLSACTVGTGAAFYGVSNARTTAPFNESEVLTGFGLTTGVLHGWYTDEHAMTLGVDSIYVNNKNTPDLFYGVSNRPADYAIALMAGNATSSTTAGVVGSPFVKEGRIGTTSDPVGLANAVDAAGRPLRPGLYLTDLTVNGVNSKAGDWQMGNDNPVQPTALYGTWKAAIITIDNTKNPTTTKLVPRADPSKNHKVVGPGGTNPPAAAIDNGYSTDVQWTVASLGLTSGHAYRAQFIVHDGDQNNSGGDVGQACVNIQN